MDGEISKSGDVDGRRDRIFVNAVDVDGDRNG